MTVHLELITRENWLECSRLDVEPDQRRFITSNLQCIAELQFYPDWGAYAVYAAERMVGFVQYEYDREEDEWWIGSLMIAAGQQGRGYGKAALLELQSRLAVKGCREIWVGYADDNQTARALYGGLGFNEVGLDEEGDMVARLRLSARHRGFYKGFLYVLCGSACDLVLTRVSSPPRLTGR